MKLISRPYIGYPCQSIKRKTTPTPLEVSLLALPTCPTARLFMTPGSYWEILGSVSRQISHLSLNLQLAVGQYRTFFLSAGVAESRCQCDSMGEALLGGLYLEKHVWALLWGLVRGYTWGTCSLLASETILLHCLLLDIKSSVSW